jgi:hypothetical protein
MVADGLLAGLITLPAELFLSHRLFRSLGSGEVIDRRWLSLRYPPYWHYDVLQALLVLSRLGRAGDPRAGDALDLLVRRRRRDGRWRPGGYWWRPAGAGAGSGPVDVADWGRSGPNEMLTLNALRVLGAAADPARPPDCPARRGSGPRGWTG